MALTEALEHLRAAADAGRAALYRNFEDPELGFCSGIFAESCAAGIPSSLAGGFADRIPWSSVPAEHMRTQAAGLPVGGPTAVVFATTPRICQALLADGILSVQFFPLHLAAEWWGYIGFDDYNSAREWDEEELLLQRTAVAMIGGALRRWRTEAQLQVAHDAAILHQERQRLARELHDALTQSVYSIALFARAGGDALARGEPEQARQILHTVETTASRTLVEMRLLLFELQPAEVVQGSLQEVIEARFNLVERRLGIQARYAGESAPPPPVRDILLPIAFEALNNALKHAAATRVTVTVASEDHARDGAAACISLTVADDGKGFDPLNGCPGLGLRTMRERAAAAGGRLWIESTPGVGTRVYCSLAPRPSQLQNQATAMHQSDSPQDTPPIRVLVAEDHTVVRQAFCLLLADPRYGVAVVGEAGDGVAAVALAQALRPDVIIMDLFMPNMGGVAATQAILQQNPGARVLVLTGDENEADVLAALRAGALGFVPKRASVDELVHTIHSVALDHLVVPRALAARLAAAAPEPGAPAAISTLTARELEVLACLARGLGNRAIARTLAISTDTVRSHISHLLPKLNATNRTQAVVHARQLGVLDHGQA